MSRLSFRPRPLDIHKKLPIVRSLKDIDNEEAGVSRMVHHAHVALDADNEEVLTTSDTKGGKEIPTPDCDIVETYTTDYKATFVQPPSYVRSAGVRAEIGDYIEYDLDDDDEDWLAQLNQERRLLAPEKFEAMLFRLDLLAAKCQDRGPGPPGVMPMGSAVNSTVSIMLGRDVAFEALRGYGARQAVLTAVYDYWLAKRERMQKPLLRRFWPQPAATDTNPFNVFRPRERVQRPHTRRMQRRENDVPSFQKLQRVRQNLEAARLLLDTVHKRELKKKEVIANECEVQLLQIRLRHDSRAEIDQMEAQVAAEVAQRKGTARARSDSRGSGAVAARPTQVERAPTSAYPNGHIFEPKRVVAMRTPVATAAEHAHEQVATHKRKRRRVPLPKGRPTGALIVPARPPPFEPEMLFAMPLDDARLESTGVASALITAVASRKHCVGRVGRGGRIIFDRCHPFTRIPYGVSELPNGTHADPPEEYSKRPTSPPPPRLEQEDRTEALDSVTVSEQPNGPLDTH
eukprot:jgi/Chlat1/4284/Chrsp29S04377